MNTQPLIKKTNARVASPVVITKVRAVGTDGQTVQLELRQKVVNEVTNTSGLLSVLMAGHSAFASTERTRVCWQNFSIAQFRTLGLPVTEEELAAAGTAGIKFLEHPLPFNLIIGGKECETKIVEVDTFTPWSRRLADGTLQQQQPKRAGVGGSILMQDNKPIYRNTILAVKGEGLNMDFEDTIIPHNNTVVGSTLANRAEAGSAAAAASMAGANTTTVGNPALAVVDENDPQKGSNSPAVAQNSKPEAKPAAGTVGASKEAIK